MTRLAFTFLIALALLASIDSVVAQDGFCMVNGTTTGGAGGPTVTVTNGTDFVSQVGLTGARIIQVNGVLSVGDATVRSDKTIIGVSDNATLLGRLSISGVTNVIVRNLRITNPGNDGISIRDPNTHHVWVDHVTFYDCGDGSCDISQGADYVTVSWCKFMYPTQLEHRFTMIADGTATGQGQITLHHNWWSDRADQRQAATSYGRIHYYNNFFNATNNSYCSNARTNAELNSENNYYAGVKDAIGISSGTNGKIKTSGNLYVGCSGTIHPGTDSVFTPPYAYTLDATADVPGLVTNGVGAPGPDTVPIPPKIWDGGGADNNLNTANNWGYAGGYNETPKEYDVMLFAGSTRLAPNNNFTANNEYAALNFSNNAGAFVLGGNALNLGQGITNDSTATQTINLNLDFTYAADHFPTNRYLNVTAPNGSLVINGRIAGTTNIYGKLYSVTKLGPGLLTLAGLNNFPANFNFNGGLVRFSSLSTNVAGSLGFCTNLVFNGGGLQWAAGNTSDLSSNIVTFQSGGAVFDVGANSVTFTSRIGNNGAGGLTKLGTGTLTFNATNNYKGNTLIAQGTLALGLNGLLTNSPQLILSNNAILDVSGRSDGTQTLLSGKSLIGNGTVRGNVIAASGSTIAPGSSVDTLTVAGNVTLGGNMVMELDRSLTPNSDRLVTSGGSITGGGTLTTTNIGPALQVGDTFQLFAAGVSGITANLQTVDALNAVTYTWQNNIASTGSIMVQSVTPIGQPTLEVTQSGNSLTFSWTGPFKLQSQTNSLSVGVSNNWGDYQGGGSSPVNVTINPNNPTVFFRLSLQ